MREGGREGGREEEGVFVYIARHRERASTERSQTQRGRGESSERDRGGVPAYLFPIEPLFII